jgi:hypothetical protein
MFSLKLFSLVRCVDRKCVEAGVTKYPVYPEGQNVAECGSMALNQGVSSIRDLKCEIGD